MQGIISRIFDDIVVVGLAGSIDRRAHISRHFADVGITAYEFFDAIAADDPLVSDAFADGRVKRFPPCFRCGKDDCGRPDCNNVLIAPQVANVLTYRALWRQLAEQDRWTLIMEDDVVIHDYAGDVLSELASAVEKGTLDFDRASILLLRLGWALGPDHAPGPMSVQPVLRMANPCHAMTGAYARKLLAVPIDIDTTSDIVVHQRTPDPGEALSVFPPIASDLSWSTGALPSLIHPKPLHVEHLRRLGDDEAANRHESLVLRHFKHMYRRSFLIVGHPRCGTGFSAALFRQMGYDVGHEDDGRDGLSSWMFAVEDDAPWAKSPIALNRRALVADHLIHAVRDPDTAIPSIMRENRYAPVSFAYRRRHILLAFGVDIEALDNPIEAAVASLYFWSRLIAAQTPSFIFRIEADAGRLAAFLKEQANGSQIDVKLLDLSPVNSDKLYQKKRYPKEIVTEADWRGLSDAGSEWLRSYCKAYDYSSPIG